MANSAPAPEVDFDLEVIGEFTDDHLAILAQLLVDLDAESDHHATALPTADGDNQPGTTETTE